MSRLIYISPKEGTLHSAYCAAENMFILITHYAAPPLINIGSRSDEIRNRAFMGENNGYRALDDNCSIIVKKWS